MKFALLFTFSDVSITTLNLYLTVAGHISYQPSALLISFLGEFANTLRHVFSAEAVFSQTLRVRNPRKVYLPSVSLCTSTELDMSDAMFSIYSYARFGGRLQSRSTTSFGVRTT